MTEQRPGGRNHYHWGRWRGVTPCYDEDSDSPGVNKKGQSVSPEAIWWKVTRGYRKALSVVGRLTELGTEFSQAGAHQKWPSRLSFELCYKNDFHTLYMLPTTLLSYSFRESFSDPDWQMDWPQVSSAMVCVMSLVLMAFLPAGQKYSPPTWNMQLDLRKGLLKEAIPNFGLPWSCRVTTAFPLSHKSLACALWVKCNPCVG